jgi:hypothetical protein
MPLVLHTTHTTSGDNKMRNPKFDEFADACCGMNTVEQLQDALNEQQHSPDCLSDCRLWKLDYEEWREAIADALVRLQAQ